MSAEIGPVFFTAYRCALYLGIHAKQVSKHLGRPDCFARVSWREDPLFLRSRVLPRPDDVWIDDLDCGKTLYTLIEASKRIGTTRMVAFRRLPTPVGTLKLAGKNAYLYRESQIVELKKAISSGDVKIQPRSLKARKIGAYLSEPRHCLASDQSAEQSRVAKVRAQEAFWSRMV